jgi:hypothetical protein
MTAVDRARLLGRPPYQDLLRALGRLLDEEGWRDVLVLEQPTGFVISGRRPDRPGEGVAVRRLTRVEVYALVRAAHRRRGTGPLARRPRHSRLAALREGGGGPGTASLSTWLAGDSYESRLRALGWLGDASGLQQVRVREEGDDLILEGDRDGALGMAPTRLTPPQVGRLLIRLTGMRQPAPAADGSPA